MRNLQCFGQRSVACVQKVVPWTRQKVSANQTMMTRDLHSLYRAAYVAVWAGARRTLLMNVVTLRYDKDKDRIKDKKARAFRVKTTTATFSYAAAVFLHAGDGIVHVQPRRTDRQYYKWQFETPMQTPVVRITTADLLLCRLLTGGCCCPRSVSTTPLPLYSSPRPSHQCGQFSFVRLTCRSLHFYFILMISLLYINLGGNIIPV